MNTSRDELVVHGPHFAERVRRNQQRLGSELKAQYDFIVCGSGSSGAVAARRLAEHADVSVLLLEAGGQDDLPTVMRAGQWPLILGSEQDWYFAAQPNPHLNGRSIPYDMGKVLGGGSSINAGRKTNNPHRQWPVGLRNSRGRAAVRPAVRSHPQPVSVGDHRHLPGQVPHAQRQRVLLGSTVVA